MVREKLNCPNCGAPISGTVCDYCGTVFLDFGAIEIFKPMWLRIRLAGRLTCLRVIPERLSIETIPQRVMFYADDTIQSPTLDAGYNISLDFVSTAADDGTMMIQMPENKATVDPVDLLPR